MFIIHTHSIKYIVDDIIFIYEFKCSYMLSISDKRKQYVYLRYSIYTLNSRKISKIWNEIRINLDIVRTMFGCNEDKIGMKLKGDLEKIKLASSIISSVDLIKHTCRNSTILFFSTLIILSMSSIHIKKLMFILNN